MTDDLLDEASIPATLTGVLESRLDALPEIGRRSLQLASVVGRTFWDKAVEALGTEAPDFVAALASELVFSQRSSTFPLSSELTFKHALLHDVSYNTVLLSERPALHQRAAEWLAAAVGERRDEYLEEIASHFDLAGLGDQAAELMFEAASRADKAGDAASARRLVETGLAAATTTASNPQALILLANSCGSLGDLSAASEAADAAMQLAEELGDNASLVSAIAAAFMISDNKGTLERSRELVSRGLSIARELGGDNLPKMLGLLAWSYLNSGDLDGAKRNAAEGLRLAEEAGDVRTLAQAHTISGNIAAAGGDHEASLVHLGRVLDLATQSGDLSAVALVHLNSGVSWHYLADSSGRESDYDRAQEEYEAALSLTRRLGMRILEGRALGNMAQLQLMQGSNPRARNLARDCLTLALENGSRPDMLFAVLVHSEASCDGGINPDALRHIGAVAADPGLGRLEAEVDAAIDRIRKLSPTVDVDQAIEAGRTVSFDDVVAEIIGQNAAQGS